MCKRLLICLSVLLLAGTQSFGAIGIFDFAKDINAPGGSSSYDGGTDTYLITAGPGRDIWEKSDAFHYLYSMTTGSVRLSADFEWVASRDANAKMGVMVRAPATLGSEAERRAVNYFSMAKRPEEQAIMQGRDSSGGTLATTPDEYSYNDGLLRRPYWSWGVQPYRLGIQRVWCGPYPVVETLVDEGYGGGWEVISERPILAYNLYNPVQSNYKNIMIGIAVTAHTTTAGVTTIAEASNVEYLNSNKGDTVGLISKLPTVKNPSAEPCSDIKGFYIRTVQLGTSPSTNAADYWNWRTMADLLDNENIDEFNPLSGPGGPEPWVSKRWRIEPYVNLYDSGTRGQFNGTGGGSGMDVDPLDAAYKDQSYPRIDPFDQSGTANPVGGDVDTYFATQVDACIHLTAGYHVIGINSDDGTRLVIGDVEIRTALNRSPYNTDFLFYAEETGWYNLLAQALQITGGAGLELQEVIADAASPNGLRRILLGDTARGGSEVRIPEPATIALLGLGGLSLLGIRRKR